MKKIPYATAEFILSLDPLPVQSATIERDIPSDSWYIILSISHQKIGVQSYLMYTRRGSLRTWKDFNRLLAFFKKHNFPKDRIIFNNDVLAKAWHSY